MNKNLRNKLDNHEVSYNPKHWEQLNSRLADQNRRKVWWQYGMIATVVCGVLLVGSLSYQYIGKNDLKLTDKVGAEKLYTNKVEQSLAVAQNKEMKTVEVVADLQTVDNKADKVENATKVKAKTTSKTIAKTTSVAETKAVGQTNLLENAQKNVAKNKNLIQTKDKNVASLLPNKTQKTSISSLAEQKTPVNALAEEQKIQYFILQGKNKVVLGYDTLKPPIIPYYRKTNNSANMPTLAEATPKIRRFRLGLATMLMNTNLSVSNENQSNVVGVGSQHSNKTTQQALAMNMGLLAEYSVGRFSIGTGALLAGYELNYGKSENSQIALDTFSLLNKSASNNVTYKIKQLLIPITVRYDAVVGKKGKWFASAMLINNFLLESTKQEEKVAFFFENDQPVITSTPSQTPNTKTIFRYSQQTEKVETNNFIPLTALQFQIGYERNVGKHFSYQIEPFVRLALRSETDSQFQVSATGVCVRMNYLR
jgi:hypothetical protein